MRITQAAAALIAAWLITACGPPNCPCEAREGHEAVESEGEGDAKPDQGGGAARDSQAGAVDNSKAGAVEDSTAGAVDNSKAEDVKQALLELFRHCHGGEYEKAADYIVYRGSDKTSAWKRTCSYADPDEKGQVEEVCSAIKGFLQEGGNPQFLEFTTETESEGQWLVWKVRFEAAGGPEEAFFAFLRVGEVYALGDID